jgi:hypothetical protein
MKFSALKSVGHNIAASLASGVGLMIGLYGTDIFREASAGAPGYIDVDFLLGSMSGSTPSRGLREAVALFSSKALLDLCRKHGVDLRDVRTIQARFEVASVIGPHYTVTVEDTKGKRAVDQFVGIPGRRLRRRQGERIALPDGGSDESGT